jgi:tRNA pseudouridine38-40 synthase
MLRGVRLTLAYDGTAYAGFQRQPSARTIQSELEAAIARVTQNHTVVRGAGRTDAGVHAEGQVVAFDTERVLPARRWLLALNRYLPDDIAVQAVHDCEPGYNPRFDAMGKLYRYLFYLGLARSPLLRHRAWHLARVRGGDTSQDAELSSHSCRLDVPAMRDTARALVGTHDFRAFRAADDARPNATRTMHRLELIQPFRDDPHLLALEVHGSAFMKNMVRVFAGTLVAVGRGRMRTDDVAALLGPAAVRSKLSETAPAHGLTLVHVSLGRSQMARPADR